MDKGSPNHYIYSIYILDWDCTQVIVPLFFLHVCRTMNPLTSDWREITAYLHHVRCCVVKIQAVVRTCIAQRQYHQIRARVIKLQAYTRGYLVTREYHHTHWKLIVTSQACIHAWLHCKMNVEAVDVLSCQITSSVFTMGYTVNLIVYFDTIFVIHTQHSLMWFQHHS